MNTLYQCQRQNNKSQRKERAVYIEKWIEETPTMTRVNFFNYFYDELPSIVEGINDRKLY